MTATIYFLSMGGFRSNYVSRPSRIIRDDRSATASSAISCAIKYDYDYVRAYASSNLIMPVVGDFAGPRLLPESAISWKKTRLHGSCLLSVKRRTVIFFMTIISARSAICEKLPITDKSLRFDLSSGRSPHPARQPEPSVVTLIEQISVGFEGLLCGRINSRQRSGHIHYSRLAHEKFTPETQRHRTPENHSFVSGLCVSVVSLFVSLISISSGIPNLA